MHRDEIPTPAILVDLDRFERNIGRMAEHMRATHKHLRPHAKTHRCAEIARRQIAAGAIGVSCAKLGEAEVLAENGVRGLLITSELVAPASIKRLIDLVRLAPDTIIVVDHLDNVNAVAEAAGSGGVVVNVLVDVDLGDRRTGVPPDEAVVKLAKVIAAHPSLRFRGMQGYAGRCGHVRDWAERRETSRNAMAPLLESCRLLAAQGLPAEIVSGSSTGTYDIDTELPEVTELQCGSYCVMDIDYGHINGRDGRPLTAEFEVALSVVGTVISVPNPARGVVDAGLKAFSAEKPFPPEPVKRPGVVYEFAGDELGRLVVGDLSQPLRLGERIEFVPPHCDPTINLYDRIYAMRGDLVEGIWPISARGRSD